MAWPANFPPSSASVPPTDIQAWAFIEHYWRAVWERRWMFDNNYYMMRQNVVWAGGIIESQVDNGNGTWTYTVEDALPAGGTDDGRYWNGVTRPSPFSTDPYWVGFEDPDLPYIPANYDVIIEYDNDEDEWYRDIKPWEVLRGDLTATTSQTFTVSFNPDDYVTAGFIPDTDLVGKTFQFIKTGGLWWGGVNPALTRYLDPPNDNELWRGVADSGKIYSDGTGYLIETTNKYTDYNSLPLQRWIPDEWVDDPPIEVLVFDNESPARLHRLEVTGNNDNTLFFGGITAIPGTGTVDYEIDGAYSMVEQDAQCWPGKEPSCPWWWYGGAQRSVITHDPTDVLTARDKAFALDSKTWEELESLDGASCGDPVSIKTEVTYDKDSWTSVINMCEPADHCWSPYLYKSFRQVQVAIEEMILNSDFVRPQSYAGVKEVVRYSVARAFHDAGVNAGTDTTFDVNIGGTNTDYRFQVPSELFELNGLWPVYWEVVKDGLRKGVGQTTPNEFGEVIVATTATYDATWDNADVWWTAGWTRNQRLEFRYMYERGAFIPDLVTDEEGTTAVYPPEVSDFCGEPGPGPDCEKNCMGVGTWHWKPKSTTLRLFDQYGYALESAEPIEAGQIARHVGDNWHDPGTHIPGLGDSADTQPDWDYWDCFYEGVHTKTKQDKIIVQRSGYATSANKYSITDSNKNWWDHWKTPNGVAHIELGIATGGSTTTLVTSTALTDLADAKHCFWQASRFIGTLFESKPYKNFILEIDNEELDEDDEPVTRTYKVPITNVTTFTAGNAPTLTFVAVPKLDGSGTLTVAAGQVWRIREPGTILHRYRGKRVRITRANGTVVELEITHNDDTTLFFAVQAEPFDVGDRYQIIEYDAGRVWKVQATEPSTLEKATGIAWQKMTDTLFLVQPTGADARGEDFHWNMLENLPHKRANKMYGRLMKGDAVYEDTVLEPYKVLNQLKRSKIPISWTSRADPEVPELNTTGGVALAEINDVVNSTNLATWVSQGKANATAAYAAGTVYPSGDIEFPQEQDGVPPGAGSGWSAEINTSSDFMSGPWFLGASYAYGKVTLSPVLIARQVEMYGYAAIDEDDTDAFFTDGDSLNFDSYGSPFAYRQMTLFFTSTVNKNATIISTKIGELTTPAWPPDIVIADLVVGKVNYARSAQYTVINQIAIVKWDVVGGLRYVT